MKNIKVELICAGYNMLELFQIDANVKVYASTDEGRKRSKISKVFKKIEHKLKSHVLH